MPSLMEKTITRACRGSQPGTRARMKALAGVRWVLATDDGWFVSVGESLSAVLTRDARSATVYDGRDNEELKRRFMEALLRVRLTVVLLE